MMLIAWDVVWTPLQTFEPAPNVFSYLMDWLHLSFWSIDLPASFFVGYFQNGQLVMNLAKISKRYFRTWFTLDVFLVAFDWLIVALDSEDGSNEMASIGLFRAGKVVRIIRMLRVIRLLRLLKLRKYFSRLEEHISSRHALVLLGIVKITLMILVINHFVACSWWLVGTMPPPRGHSTWQESHPTVPNISAESLEYKYLTSLHWSITQFTPAAMEVYATNTTERLMSVVVIIFALVTFSSFVSSITNAMNDLRSINAEQAKQLLVFQRFIRSKGISTELAVRMRRHLEHTIVAKQRHLHEKEVHLLKMLSEPLLMELHFEIYMKYLDCHPFFHKFSETNPTGIRKLCHTAIAEVTVSRHDILFNVGDRAEKVFFVQSGMLAYTSAGTKYEKVHPSSDSPDWLCEACLWTKWMCVGCAEGTERTVVVTVGSNEFLEVVKSCKGLLFHPIRYAQMFVDYLNAADEDDLSDLPAHKGSPNTGDGSPASARRMAFDSEKAVGHICDE
jgi:hypothetical protein